MADVDRKKMIDSTIRDFHTQPFSTTALSLFSTLGYNTSREGSFREKTFQDFQSVFLVNENLINEEKALVQEWKSINLLFQLTQDEISYQQSMFGTKEVQWKGEDQTTVIETYLFFALELEKQEYSRSALSQITREINKVFPMPAMILFKYGDKITLSVIHRRLNKKDRQKDVLEKVVLIKDVSLIHPHRAHIEILFDLSSEALQRTYEIDNFVDLHKAWTETLDTKELNKRFYKELSEWYFWALQEVSFPTQSMESTENSLFQDQDRTKEHNAKNLIRMLTRILFVWFIKEKGLIPEELFESNYIREHLLNQFEPQKIKEKSKEQRGKIYYCAILQNLFFATLNQVMGKREFWKKGQQKNITNLMRYEQFFKDPKHFVELVESKVPFMNGGLFECLDIQKEDGCFFYEDGFSDQLDNDIYVPDYIFFGSEDHVDLSPELEGINEKDVSVRGLIRILNGYKFTVTENTPIEEDIALDPELLGRVFENLLASYNPETQMTARKQTGSFNTPKEIVAFMVDEVLKAHLKQVLVEKAKMDSEIAIQKLEILLGYNETPNPFNDKENQILIQAIDSLKILDPAVGSGAFPMGILHKLVHILHKIDPKNEQWKKRQMEKVDYLIQEAETEIQDSIAAQSLVEELKKSKQRIEEDFLNNELDYGRKLYLIENCIFGVDIQPIALQISKLRFFISLIVEQRIDRNKENYGILPLPNLETKFVGADSLIHIEKPKSQYTLADSRVVEMEKQLKKIRHLIFNEKNPISKRELKAQDQRLREKMSDVLKESGWNIESAQKLSEWNPYDQNARSSFFDYKLMFGVDHFDIVIGNPPYIQLQKNSGNLGDLYSEERYETFERTGDIYSLFYERGIQLLREGGHLCYITSNKWMRTAYGESLRNYFLKNNPLLFVDLGPGIFESATVDTNIILIQRAKNIRELKGFSYDKSMGTDIAKVVCHSCIPLPFLTKDSWFIGSNSEMKLKEKIEKTGKPLKEWDVGIYYGIKTGLNEAFIIDTPTKEKICEEDPNSLEILKPILRGRDIDRYTYKWAGLWLLFIPWHFPLHNDLSVVGANEQAEKLFINKFPVIYNYLLNYKDKLSKRNKAETGIRYEWYALQRCAATYYPEFEKEKIVYPNMTKYLPFLYDNEKYYTNQKCFIITGNNIKFFTGYFNSNVSNMWIKNNCPELQGGTRELSKIFFENIPIPYADSSNNHIGEIESLVDTILSIKKSNPDTNTGKIESEIDQLVYQLYELTPEEISIVEKSTKAK